MAIIEWFGLMTITVLVVLLIAGMWVLKENGDFIVIDNSDWLVGVIVAIAFIFAAIWAIFVLFYNEPENFGYEKIIVEEMADGTDST